MASAEEFSPVEPAGDFEGQSDIGTPSETTDSEPSEVAEGQSTTELDGQADDGPVEQADTDDFFDPGEVPDDPASQKAYKAMQAAFTKKMQALSADRQKIEAYDAYQQDPLGQMKDYLDKQGYQITRRELGEAGAGNFDPNNPDSWDQVYDFMENRMLRKFGPALNQMQTLQRSQIEKQLEEIDPMWATYEEPMKENLKLYPGLASDPTKLYKLSVPSEVLEGRAVQKALKKMETKVSSGKISGGSKTTKNPGAGVPDKALSFAESVEVAKRLVAEQGLTRPNI